MTPPTKVVLICECLVFLALVLELQEIAQPLVFFGLAGAAYPEGILFGVDVDDFGTARREGRPPAVGGTVGDVETVSQEDGTSRFSGSSQEFGLILKVLQPGWIVLIHFISKNKEFFLLGLEWSNCKRFINFN